MLNIFLAQAYGVFGTIVITCYGIPWFAAVLVPLGAVYTYTQNYYRKTSRSVFLIEMANFKRFLRTRSEFLKL